MSSKYRESNTLVHYVCRNTIEGEGLERNHRTDSTNKNYRSENCYNSSGGMNITNYNYSKIENEPLRNRQENESPSSTPKYVNLEEQNREHNGEGITNLKECSEADLKKKKINEIINKYRNQLRMMHSQFNHSPENKKKNEKESEKTYEESNKFNHSLVNEKLTKKGLEGFQKNTPYEVFKEKEATNNVTRNSKTETEFNRYMNNKWNNYTTDIKPLEQEKGDDKKYQINRELNQNNSFVNFSKMEKEEEAPIRYDKECEDDPLYQYKDKRTYNVFMEDRTEHTDFSIQQKKRMHIDMERAKQIDFKKEKILKSKNRISADPIEEEREDIEIDDKKKKETREESNDNTLSFRRFFYDSIAFDEFKIKDKFREIEQIEQTIREKNLLSPVKDVTGKEEMNDRKRNVEHKADIAEKENKNENENENKNENKHENQNENKHENKNENKHENKNENKNTMYIFNEPKESYVNAGKYEKKRNYGDVHEKSVYTETFSAETSTKNKKEKKSVFSEDAHDCTRHSNVMKETNGINKIRDNHVNEMGIGNERRKGETERFLNTACHANKLSTEKNVDDCGKTHCHSECNDVVNNTYEKNNAANAIGTASNISKNTIQNITNRTLNTVTANDGISSIGEIKRVNHYNYYSYPSKSIFSIQKIANEKDEKCQAEELNDHIHDQKNTGTNNTGKTTNIGGRKYQLPHNDLRKEKEVNLRRMEHSRSLEENSIKEKEEDKKKRTGSSHYAGKIIHSHKTKEFDEKKGNGINSEVKGYGNVYEQNCSLLSNKLKEKKTEKEVPRIKEKVLDQLEENILKNANHKCMMRKEENGSVKENVLCNNTGDTGVKYVEEEERRVLLKETKETPFSFSNSFTHDRKLETTIKSAYTKEFRNDSFPKKKNSGGLKKPIYINEQHTFNNVEKDKNGGGNIIQLNKKAHLSEKETDDNKNVNGNMYETWKLRKNLQNNNDTMRKMERNENNSIVGDSKKKEQLNGSVNMRVQITPHLRLDKSTDISMLTKTQYKTDHVLNQTYDNMSDDNLQFKKGAINKEPNISEKYEKKYELLEKLKNDIEKKREENAIFFSLNHSQSRNTNLRYKKIPDNLYVTYNDGNNFSKKKRNSIITDKVFDDDDDVKEEEDRNVKNLEDGYIKDRKHSIERIQKELEIIKRCKDGKEVEDIDEHIIRDEINQKRKLYEEKIRKNFEEKIKLRRKLLEQQKEENEKHGNKTGLLNSSDTAKDEHNEYKEDTRKLMGYESERKRRTNKKRNIFDEYSSDGSYYRQMYKNLYDDECNKKWENHFYDVSDNLYLQDCSDHFFSNLKKSSSEDASLTNSIDLDLISLSKIKFDEFDYNYLNKREKMLSSNIEQNKSLNSNISKISSPQKKIHITSPLKKSQILLNDVSKKENSNCRNSMNNVVDINVEVFNIPSKEKENFILCKLVKSKTMQNETQENCDHFISEDRNSSKESVLKNHGENKTNTETVRDCKELTPFCNDPKEENRCTEQIGMRKEELKAVSYNNINNGLYENSIKKLPEKLSIEKNTLTRKKVEDSSNSLKLKKTLGKKKVLSDKSNIEHAHLNISNLEKGKPKTENPKPNLEKLKPISEKPKTDIDKPKTYINKPKTDIDTPKTDIDKPTINFEKKLKPNFEKPKTDIGKSTINLEKSQKKEVSLERKTTKNSSSTNGTTYDNSKNLNGKDLGKPISREVINGYKKEKKETVAKVTKDTFHITAQDKKPETNLPEEKNKMKIEEVKPVDNNTINTHNDSPSSSNKTMPKINILKNKENYIPLDLALNFVMDNQKLEKQVKKEKETQRPSKKKTFTQWVMEERKKRLKNNLPIDI